MKIFVTGSEGFIGSNLIEDLLKKGHKVTALVQYNSFNNIGWLKNINDKKLKIVLGDIRDEHFMFESCKNIDVIITEIQFWDYYSQKNSFYNIEKIIRKHFELYDISYVAKNPENFRTDYIDAIYVNKNLK